MIKATLVLLFLVAVCLCQSPDLVKCIEEKCPEQYQKCKISSGCQAKLEKCAAKCGQKINQTCWTLCIGLPGAAANVCTCAVNQGCIKNISLVDRIAMHAMQALENNNLRSQ